MAKAVANHSKYHDDLWNDIPIQVKMDTVARVNESLVNQNMPVMSEQHILVVTAKHLPCKRAEGVYYNASAQILDGTLIHITEARQKRMEAAASVPDQVKDDTSADEKM
jgi:hypothetical protein